MRIPGTSDDVAVRSHDTGTGGAGSVAVRAWRDGDEAPWDTCVAAHEHGTLFHLAGWKRVLEETFRYRSCYLVAERDGEPCGGLPLFSCRSIRGRRTLLSLPQTVYGGPLAADAQVERALLDAARALGRRTGACGIELRNRYPTGLPVPGVEGFVTFEKELPDSPEAVYRTFPKKAREMLNQARKRHRLQADFEEDLDVFYPLLEASFLRLGTPVFPKRFFAAIRREFPAESSILIVRHEGEAVAGVFSVQFRSTMFPLYSGEADGVRRLKANNFKYFRLMEEAVARGCTRFDFGRSRVTNEGAVRFKTNQGFEPEPLPYQAEEWSDRGHAAGRADPNRGFFLKARRWWSRLPRAVARRLGPPIVRYFP